MDVTLVRFNKDEARRDYIVKRGRCLMGRLDTCDLPIPLSSVSREHCELRIEGDAVRLKDLGSRNGTFVNGERIDGVVTLTPGDRIAIGPVVFTAQIDGEPEPIEPPLLEAPTATTARAATATTPPVGPGDKGAEALSDLIAEMDNEDSSVFDLDMFLDDDDEDESPD